jgi:serpin B
MMKRLLAIALVTGCATDPSSTDIKEVRSETPHDLQPDVTDSELATLVQGNTEFAVDLYHEASVKDGNLFMSPYSVSTALAMTYAGASTNTATQMAATLHFDLPADKLHAAFDKLAIELAARGQNAKADTIPFRLTTANAIFGATDMTLLDPFLETLARSYDAGVRVLDFAADPDAARERINAWVEDRTNDRIKDLLPAGSISEATRLVLTNAIYFSAAWAEPFEASETADHTFTTAAGAPVTVPFVHGVQERGYAQGSGYKAAELPYDGDELSMIVVVPDDLASFESSMTADVLAGIAATTKTYALDLTLPKFEFDAPLPLKQTLVDLGMTDAFDSDLADFSDIDGLRDLFIGDVLHKGFISVNENGTEAAAATAVVLNGDAAPEPATLVVDKPFVFFIRDRATGAILFIGRVVDPS